MLDVCDEFEISDGIQNPGTNYSVKQKLDRIQARREIPGLNDFPIPVAFNPKP
ncbi:hypothetical protein [Microcoleus sp. AR_TQ3_B6]|uniref:hypothetical protein n=1 Tax=Microcoleus sp. AR_TQ3_B6 TaxID=3055284 RepID=UPI002FD3EFE5